MDHQVLGQWGRRDSPGEGMQGWYQLGKVGWEERLLQGRLLAALKNKVGRRESLISYKVKELYQERIAVFYHPSSISKRDAKMQTYIYLIGL